jgi:hypothetical protein
MTKTQQDIVDESKGYLPKTQTVKVSIPGIEYLHTRTTFDIAEALANVLKSQRDIVEVRYVLGEYIELTYRT